jgi:MSHA biogenesis protein MshJ
VNRNIKSIITYLIELSLRERFLLLLIVLAVIYAAWNGLIYSKQLQYHQQLVKQQQGLVDRQLQQQVQLAENIALLTAKSHSKEQLEQAIVDAKNELQQSSEHLDAVLEGLVPPTKITELLHSVLLQTHGLKLVALNNEPVEAITILDEKTENNQPLDEQEQHAKLYKHSTSMTLSGNYQQLYHYLKMIEQSTWSLYWDKLEYHVTEYPNAKITIRVHTISSDQYWIGL